MHRFEDASARELTLLVLAAIFVAINAIGLSLAKTGGLDVRHVWYVPVWLVLISLSYVCLRVYKPEHDTFLLPLYGFLTGWGLVLQDRLAPAFIGRQVLWFVLGTIILLCVAILPSSLRPIRRYRYTLLLSGLLTLAVSLLLGVNPTGYGAALWLPVPFLDAYFQPSELLKLLIIFFFASYFADRGRLISASQQRGIFGALPYLAPLLLMWGFCVIMLVWQRDLGAATIFLILFLAMLYTATGSRNYVFVGIGLLLVAGVIGYFAFDVVALRVEAWWNPWPDFDNRAFQIVQSLYALAAGGIGGQGVGQGYPTFIPVVHSDFVFAAIAEEWGLLGAIGIVGCFAFLAQRGFRIAMLATGPFRMYVATGITVLMATQAFLIMGGVTKFLPLTGVTLPFVSYGGSSLVMACIMLGLLLFLSAE